MSLAASEKERIMRRVLEEPEAAIEALAIKELILRKRLIAWCEELGYEEQVAHDRAAVAILTSGPTALRWRFVMEPDAQWGLINGIRSVAGLWTRRNGDLQWVGL